MEYIMDKDKFDIVSMKEAKTVLSVAVEKMDFLGKKDIGKPVRVRPCDEKYQGKTFLGIFLGELPIPMHVSYDKDEQMLSISNMYNPAIFVPEINEVVFGYESWWSLINSSEDIEDITNDDISNVWYVKMLNNLDKQE